MAKIRSCQLHTDRRFGGAGESVYGDRESRRMPLERAAPCRRDSWRTGAQQPSPDDGSSYSLLVARNIDILLARLVISLCSILRILKLVSKPGDGTTGSGFLRANDKVAMRPYWEMQFAMRKGKVELPYLLQASVIDP